MAQEEPVKAHRPLAAQGNMTAALEADLIDLSAGKAVSIWHVSITWRQWDGGAARMEGGLLLLSQGAKGLFNSARLLTIANDC